MGARTSVAAFLFVVGLCGASTPALAQDAAPIFGDLAGRRIVEPGDKVWVVFAYARAGADAEIEGRITALDAGSITVESADLPVGATDLTVDRIGGRGAIRIPGERVRSIKVYRKARRWGTLIGGGAGAAMGFLAASSWEKNEGDCGRCYLIFGTFFGLIGMGAGWGVDLVRDDRPIVYAGEGLMVVLPPPPRLTFMPQVSKTRKGLLFSVTW